MIDNPRLHRFPFVTTNFSLSPSFFLTADADSYLVTLTKVSPHWPQYLNGALPRKTRIHSACTRTILFLSLLSFLDLAHTSSGIFFSLALVTLLSQIPSRPVVSCIAIPVDVNGEFPGL